MPITVQYQPGAGTLAQAAYQAGAGQFRQQGQQLAQRQQQIDLQDEQHQRSIADAQFRQGRQLESDAALQAERIAESQRSQLAGFDFQGEQAQLNRDYQRENLIYSTEQQAARQQAQIDATSANLSSQLYAQRLNQMSQIQAQQVSQARQIQAQQQSQVFGHLAGLQQNAQRAQLNAWQQGQAQQGQLAANQILNQQRFEQSKQLYDAQQQSQLQTAQAQYTWQQQQQLQQLDNQQAQVEQMLATGELTDYQAEHAMRQLQARRLGLQSMPQEPPQYPQGQGVGQMFPLQNPMTGEPITDGATGEVVPFTRDRNGDVKVVPGWKPTAPPEPETGSTDWTPEQTTSFQKAQADLALKLFGSTQTVMEGTGDNRLPVEKPRYETIEDAMRAAQMLMPDPRGGSQPAVPQPQPGNDGAALQPGAGAGQMSLPQVPVAPGVNVPVGAPDPDPMPRVVEQAHDAMDMARQAYRAADNPDDQMVADNAYKRMNAIISRSGYNPRTWANRDVTAFHSAIEDAKRILGK